MAFAQTWWLSPDFSHVIMASCFCPKNMCNWSTLVLIYFLCFFLRAWTPLSFRLFLCAGTPIREDEAWSYSHGMSMPSCRITSHNRQLILLCGIITMASNEFYPKMGIGHLMLVGGCSRPIHVPCPLEYALGYFWVAWQISVVCLSRCMYGLCRRPESKN